MRFFALTEFCPIGSSFCADHACKNCTMRVPLAGCPALTFEFHLRRRRIWNHRDMPVVAQLPRGRGTRRGLRQRHRRHPVRGLRWRRRRHVERGGRHQHVR